MNNWSKYISDTSGRGPRPILVEATQLCANKESALDLGAGALNESRFLAEAGFQVIAVENNPRVPKPIAGIDVVAASIENYSFPSDSFDIVAALYVLPFLKKESLSLIMQKIVNSLHAGGIFVGQFFGERDEWSKRCATHTKNEIEGLFTDMKILKFEEEEVDAPTAAGNLKHWHVFHVIARK